MTQQLDEDRAEAAFRAALSGVDELGVAPGAVRERLRRRRTGVAVGSVVVLALAVLPWLPQFAATPEVGGGPTMRTPPAGWRIEQYRDVSIFVPNSWGYASAPYVDWCGASPDGQPLPAQQKPYVSLGVPNDLAPAVEAPNGCPDPPDSLTTEHVELKEAGSDPASPAPTMERQGDWWVAIRIFDANLATSSAAITVKVVSQDEDLAARIADFAEVGGGPCPSTSPVQEGHRNIGSVDLSQFASADRAVVCQYKPGLATAPTYPPGVQMPAGGYRRTTGLIAATTRSRDDARELVSTLRTAVVAGRSPAACREDSSWPAFAVAVHLYARSREATIFLTAGGCSVDDSITGKTKSGDASSGIDLGTSIYPWNRAVCDAVVVPPIAANRWADPWACSR